MGGNVLSTPTYYLSIGYIEKLYHAYILLCLTHNSICVRGWLFVAEHLPLIYLSFDCFNYIYKVVETTNIVNTKFLQLDKNEGSDNLDNLWVND